MSLKENPISDRRLLKLIEQCRTKQILDYVKQHCNKTSTPNNVSRRKSGNKSKAEHADEDDVEYKFNITVKSSFPNFKVLPNI